MAQDGNAADKTMTASFDIRPIRRALIEADLVDCMVASPGLLFYSTQIPVCLWFLAKNKNADAKRGFRDRRKQTLFFDAHDFAADKMGLFSQNGAITT